MSLLDMFMAGWFRSGPGRIERGKMNHRRAKRAPSRSKTIGVIWPNTFVIILMAPSLCSFEEIAGSDIAAGISRPAIRSNNKGEYESLQSHIKDGSRTCRLVVNVSSMYKFQSIWSNTSGDILEANMESKVTSLGLKSHTWQVNKFVRDQ